MHQMLVYIHKHMSHASIADVITAVCKSERTLIYTVLSRPAFQMCSGTRGARHKNDAEIATLSTW